MAILYDHREERSGIPRRLRDAGVEVAAHQLPVGDYIVSDRLAVERKSMGDLAQSIADGRLFEQVTRLKEAYPNVVLLVEAEGGQPSQMSRAARHGALGWALRHGVSVMPVRDTDASAQWLELLCRQETNSSAQPRGSRKKPKDMDALAEFVVAGVPGVSATLARSLLARFGTIGQLAAADTHELMQVPGIGKKRAAALAGLFRHRHGRGD